MPICKKLCALRIIFYRRQNFLFFYNNYIIISLILQIFASSQFFEIILSYTNLERFFLTIKTSQIFYIQLVFYYYLIEFSKIN